MNAPHIIYADWQYPTPLDEYDVDQISYVVGNELAKEVQDVLLKRKQIKSEDESVKRLLRAVDELHMKLNRKWLEEQ